MKKRIVTKQFKVKGNANLDKVVNQYTTANEIELSDISQLNFNADHTSAILVFLTEKTDKELINPGKQEEDTE
jgi:hypothetical protein